MAATFRFTSDTFEPNLPHISFSDSEDRRLERERMMFSSDPNKVETIVSHLMKDYVPDKSKEKLAMSPTLAKVEAAMPSDDPRRGMGSKIMAESTIGIAANPDKHPLEVIKEIYDRNVEERKKATYTYLEDKEKGFLGLPGTGTSLFTGSVIGKKYANMPGYDEYKQKKDEYNRTHFTLDEFSSPQSAAALGGILTAIGVGAEKLGTSAGTIGKVARVAAKFLPTGFKAIPNPLLRVGLTALASIPEFWAFEGIHQAVTKAPGMEDVPELPKQVLGFIAGGAGMSQLSKGIAKRIDKWGEARYAANDAVNKMMQDPSLKNVVDSFDKERYMKKSAELFQDDFSMRGTPGSAAAKVGSSKAKISMEQMSRIEGKINEGLQVEDAVGQVLTEDKLLGALDAVKTNKFFDELLKSSADKQEKALKNRLFRDAINRGLGPDEAILEVQRGTAKWELDDIINFGNNATVTHAPEVAAGLRMLGYSDEAINKIPLRMGKTLSKRRMIEANAERSKLELEGQKLFAEEAGTATEARLVNPLQPEEITRAKSAVAETEKLLGGVVPEGQKIGLSGKPKYFFAEGEPAKTADEETWYRYFKNVTGGEGGAATEANMFTFEGNIPKPLPEGTHTVRKIPESAMKAYNRVYEERLDAVHKKVVESVEADKEVVQEVIKQNYYEPTEGMKSVMSDFVTDEQYAKAMLNLEELGIGKKGDFAASTAAGVGTKKKRVATPKKVVKQVAEDAETIEAVGAENISKAGAEGKVKKEKRDFNRESVDLYTRMSQGKISQDEYDSALNSLMNEHGGGGWGKMMAAITAGAGALSALSAFAPSEAEAAGLPNGVITNANYSIVSGIKKTFKEVIKEIVDKKLFVPEYVKGTFDFGDKGYAISIIPDIMNVSAKYRSSKKMFAQQYLSPNVVADFLYNATTKDGRRLPTNPMPEIASRTAISQGNTAKAFSLVQDVLSMVTGGESHMKEVSEAMKPLLEMNMTASRVSFHRGNISKLDEMIEGLIKKKSKLSGDEALAMDGNIEKLMMMQDASNQAISELKFNKEAFDKQWRTIAEGLAEKYPSTRIALALEGEGMAANDPWVLKHLTDREKEAVGHLRKLHNKIAEYIIDVGGKPIMEKPYIHHAAHPDMDWKGLQKSLEGYSLESQNILPLSRLFHREYNSKQMMPDIHYVMQQYLPDIFKRIEMMDFWKKGKPNGWSAHMHALEQMGWRAPAEFMKSIAQGFLPEDRTWANNIARQAYALEAARLIGFNPAPGFKHLMKLEANWSNFGVKMGLTNLPKAFDIYKKEVGAAVLEKMTGKKVTRDMETELYRTFTHAGNMSAIIQDLGLYEPPRGWVEKIGRQLSDYTGTIINNTERFDRAMSFVGSMEMAAKQGMTAEQAIYNLYDTILKTNFLSGNQNPSWLRNPKIRAMMMFQGTPFKIAEQRALLAVRAGRGIKKGWDEYYKQLQDIRKMVGEGEKEFKWNLIKDALESEKDINGIPYAYQLMRKVMILGTVITGGAALFDADMTGHMLHLPFVKHEGGLKVNLNPVLSAAMETKAKEDEFWLSSFFKRWLGSAPFGAAVGKAARLKEDDIPKIYRDSKFRYFFGVPATKEE
jgi:hypothetical protein